MARHTFHCPLRWSDMDAYGHVNNVQYLRYLEEARIDMLFAVGGRDGLFNETEGAVLARQEIDFRRPLHYAAVGVDVDVWVTDVTSRKFVLDYRVYTGATVFATARSVLVPFDLVVGSSRPVSARERAFLESYRDKEVVPTG